MSRDATNVPSLSSLTPPQKKCSRMWGQHVQGDEARSEKCPPYFKYPISLACTIAYRSRPGGYKIDPLRISPDQLSCMQWRSTRSLQQFSAQTDLYYPRFCNFSADILKQVPILAGELGLWALCRHEKAGRSRK